ncbi:MAG: hypothetical protein JNK51_08870 [Blastocatellia bacterium]|nr:hypothetical protein [Blastocatellia bacterium]
MQLRSSNRSIRVWDSEEEEWGEWKTSHRPEQRSGETLKYTTYNYNPDDSILSITDGRGVVTNYTYNSRGLVEEMTWDVGETGVTDAHDVEFGYDALGNRAGNTGPKCSSGPSDKRELSCFHPIGAKLLSVRRWFL